MKVWIVGQYKGGKTGKVLWTFQGVFDNEKRAVKACKDKNYFIGPTDLNKELPKKTVSWPGFYYPLCEKE